MEFSRTIVQTIGQSEACAGTQRRSASASGTEQLEVGTGDLVPGGIF